ncbi:MAG: ABC transporter permease subunit [Spirochaetales bacterium]|nr:ABC transporter permease subunit [Spirochaetales bacterium]
MVLKGKQRKLLADTFSYLYLAVFVVITMVPIWWVVTLSFESSRSIFSTEITLLPEKFTFQHYFDIFSNEDFLMWLKNSSIFASGTTVIALFIATLAAYSFSRFRFKGKKPWMIAFIIFMMLPTTASLLPQYLLLRNLNLINTYVGMILIYTAGSQTFAVWNLKGYFDTIPKTIEEAASIDGAGKMQIFFRIIIPLAKPAIAITALIIFLGPWTDFAGIFLFISDPKKLTLAMGLKIWAGDMRSVPWSQFAAGALIVAAPIGIFNLIFQRYIISGLTAGSIKG